MSRKSRGAPRSTSATTFLATRSGRLSSETSLHGSVVGGWSWRGRTGSGIRAQEYIFQRAPEGATTTDRNSSANKNGCLERVKSSVPHCRDAPWGVSEAERIFQLAGMPGVGAPIPPPRSRPPGRLYSGGHFPYTPSELPLLSSTESERSTFCQS